MERRLYSDAMTNYLVLRCPDEAQNGYQYRMLAVNRIKGLLPCSLRIIDGEHFLYYGITSRQSVARMYDHRMITGAELRKILYSLSGMIQTLSEFLLDPEKLLLDPEYIFYDFEEERYFFTYYPEVQEKKQTELFEYLSERMDENNEEARIVIYRLCELSENPNFVLRDTLLDHEYRIAEVGEDLETEEKDNKSGADEKTSETDFVSRQKKSSRKSKQRETEEEDPFEDLEELPDMEDAVGEKNRKKKKRTSEKNKQKKTGISPGKLLGIAISFFVLAAVLWGCTWWIGFTEEELLAARSGVLGSLILAVLTAVGGVLISWRNGRRELQEEQKRLEKERKNAMVPTQE